jgi:hypothetical protein
VFLAVDQEARGGGEEGSQELLGIRRKVGFLKRAVHQANPPVASLLANGKRRVAHAEAGVAALFEIARGAAEADDQEIAKALLGFGQIAAGVHGGEEVVMRDLFVKRGDQALKTVLAD